jgi:hypothetical protein
VSHRRGPTRASIEAEDGVRCNAALARFRASHGSLPTRRDATRLLGVLSCALTVAWEAREMA